MTQQQWRRHRKHVAYGWNCREDATSRRCAGEEARPTAGAENGLSHLISILIHYSFRLSRDDCQTCVISAVMRQTEGWVGVFSTNSSYRWLQISRLPLLDPLALLISLVG